MAKGKRKCTAKQSLFAQEYNVDRNATQAAKRAGYKGNNLDNIGAQLLRKSWVLEEVNKYQEARSVRTQITADMVINELAKIAFGSVTDVMEWDSKGVSLVDSKNLTADQAATISEVSSSETKEGVNMRLKQHDKKGALELLGRHLGMFKDKIELSGDVSIVSIIEEGRKRAIQQR